MPDFVIHRIGGLEKVILDGNQAPFVIHRIGGLEICPDVDKWVLGVIHRIGGLEKSVQSLALPSLCYTPCR